MDSAGVHEQVADVAEVLYKRADEVAILLAGAIRREVRLYQPGAAVPLQVVATTCGTHIRAIFGALTAQSDFDPTVATEVGIERARNGLALSSVMEGYRVGFRRLWEAVAEEVGTRAHASVKVLRILTADLLAAQHVFTSAMAQGYRDEQTGRLLREESDRRGLVDALLHGRLLDKWSLWEVADYLRLPHRGPYVVIAAETLVGVGESLPDIESKLRSLDVYSAWQQLPDLHVGIVHIRTDKQHDDVLALLSRTASARVGVSASFDDLSDTAQALRYARVALRGRADAGQLVSVFDGSILASAAVTAPEVMTKLVASTLDCFADMGDEEREILFETLRVWLDNDGSLRVTGELLFCHPNTVRYRLHRIEQRTGRALSRPRDVAELALALEVHRRLM